MPLVMASSVGCCRLAGTRSDVDGFPSFLPREVQKIKDPYARRLAARIERVPVQTSLLEKPILSSCIRPKPLEKDCKKNTDPVVLLHGFDSSCLEWRYTFPLLENAGLETWAIDILGWGFSDLETCPPCNAAAKREHLYQFWRMYIKKPMILVGPSLGAASAIDFATYHPEAVSKLVLIDASVFAEGTGNLATLPRLVAYAGVAVLKSVPLRLYANWLCFKDLSLSTNFDWMNIGRLHCLLPWWDNALVDFMLSGGYNVRDQIQKIKQKALIIWGMEDKVINSTFALILHDEILDSFLLQMPECGHLPHVEKPESLAAIILDFALGN